MNDRDFILCLDNLGYNMRVIEALWKSLKGSCGINRMDGGKSSLYASLQKSKESIRQMMVGEFNTKERLLDKMGRRGRKENRDTEGIP